MKYKGTISYRITEDHPDRKYFKGDISKRLTFSDVYTVKEDISRESIVAYIKADLALVAGGGYDTDHIRDVRFTIKEVKQ
jgi:hypothetical protein